MNPQELTDNDLLTEIGRRFNEKNASIHEMEFMTKKLLDLNERLSRADTEKDTFLSLIKNEFNNPIFSVLNLCSALLKKASPEVHSIIDMMAMELLKLDFQINNIITASEIEAGKTSSYYSLTNINDLIDEAEREIRYPLSEKSLTVRRSVILDPFVTDPAKVRMILTNLLSNAAKFADTGSLVEIRVAEVEEFVIISVIDTGEIIDFSHKKEVFNRFVKVGTFHDGLGLGLSIVRGLVESLEGEVDFECDSVQRTTLFWVKLPKVCATECEGSSSGGNDVMFDDFSGDVEF